LEFGVLIEKLPVEGGDRAQGQQSHHRAHLQPLGPAIRQLEHVVEEAVLLVPHSHVAPACARAVAIHMKCSTNLRVMSA
jgi:hypothetical protein